LDGYHATRDWPWLILTKGLKTRLKKPQILEKRLKKDYFYLYIPLLVKPKNMSKTGILNLQI